MRTFSAHQLDNEGKIINTIVVNSLDALPGETLIDASIGGSIGDSIIGGAIVQKTSETKLARIDRLQARLALLAAGKWNDIPPVIDALPEPQKSIALAYFDDAKYWYRDDPLVIQIGQSMGMKSDELDSLFISASLTINQV